MPATLRHELARKAIHFASAAVPVAYAAGVPRQTLVGVLVGAGVVAAAVERARARSARAGRLFASAVGPLLRAHEHDGRWSGATWMCVAYLLAALLFPRAEAVAAMLGVAVGDAAAAVVGRWVAARRAGDPPAVCLTEAAGPAGGARKTWAGTIACAAGTALAALAVARLTPAAALACGVAAALAERPRWALDDNVRVVVAAGAAAWGVRALGL